MSKRIENYFPLGFGVAAGLAYVCFGRSLVVWADLKDLMPTAVSVAAILAGFLATAQSIIVSIQGTRVIKMLRQGGHYESLVSYLLGGIRLCLLLGVISCIGLLLDTRLKDNALSWLFIGGWVFLATSCGLACYRVVHIFGNVLRRVGV